MSKTYNASSFVNQALSFGFTPVLLQGKVPIEKKYIEKYNSISRENLMKEANRRSDSNVGILLKGLLCIDVDLQQNGMGNWLELLQENGISDIDSIETPIVRTGSRGRHYYFQLTPEVEKCRAYLKKNGQKIGGIDVKRTGHLVYPGSVYEGCGKTPHKCGEDERNCRFRGNTYDWIKSPADIPISTPPKWLVKYLVLQSKDVHETREVNCSLAKECFVHLKERANSYHEWRDMIWCLRGLGYDIDLAHEFSRLSDKYDPESVERVWDNYDPSKGTWTWTSMFRWLKEDMDEEDYTKFCDKYLNDFKSYEIALEGDWGLSKLFIKEICSSLKLVDAKGNGYYYCRHKKLWAKIYPEFLCSIVSETLRPILKDIVDQVKQRDAIMETKDAQIYSSVLARVLTSAGATAILKQAIKELVDPSFLTKINRSPDLLPIKNGKVLCLRTLQTRDRILEDYFSFECPVEYKPYEDSKVAEDFFLGICRNDAEYVGYLRRLLAYFMSGYISDRRFYIFVGSGMNGKSTLMKLMEHMLGDFYKGLSETVMIGQERTSNCTPELLPLLTARLGVLPENRENVTLHSERLKAFTGDDALVCRPLYMEEFNFTTQAKLVLMTNTLPKFNSTDKAMVDRVVVLPFYAVFPNNAAFKENLLKHIDEIFSYIIQMMPEFWKTKRVENLPTVVKNEIDRYVRENNVVGLFVEDCCSTGKGFKIKASILYERYKSWSDENNLSPLDSKKFFNTLEKFYERGRTKTGVYYKGLQITEDLDDEKEECDQP